MRDDLRLFPTAAEIASNDGDFAVHTAQSLEMSLQVKGIRDETARAGDQLADQATPLR